MDLIATLASELNLRPEAVEAAVKLIDEGNTIPFIARYRKEATGGMDDVALRALDERLAYLRNLEQRKEDVLLLINAQGKLTPELEAEIHAATQLQRVEDLYKPYRKKRMTRAQKAREAGLEPLANMIFMQVATKGSALDEAARFVTPEAAEAGFDTPEKALAGAADIVAEVVAEDAEGRVWGFISLHAQNPEDADDPMAISQIVVSPQMHGMHAWLVARSYRLVHALRHYARALAADGGLDGRELLTA